MTARHDAAMAENSRRIAVCEAATPGPWDFMGDAVLGPIDGRSTSDWRYVAGGECDEQTHIDAEHIALHDPAAMLTIHRAMRDILTRHAPRTDTLPEYPACAHCSPNPDPSSWLFRRYPCPDAEAAMRCYETEAGE